MNVARRRRREDVIARRTGAKRRNVWLQVGARPRGLSSGWAGGEGAGGVNGEPYARRPPEHGRIRSRAPTDPDTRSFSRVTRSPRVPRPPSIIFFQRIENRRRRRRLLLFFLSFSIKLFSFATPADTVMGRSLALWTKTLSFPSRNSPNKSSKHSINTSAGTVFAPATPIKDTNTPASTPDVSIF